MFLYLNCREVRNLVVMWFFILINFSAINVQSQILDFTTKNSTNTGLSAACEFNMSLCGYKIIHDPGSPHTKWSLISKAVNRTQHSLKGNYVALVGSGKEGARSLLQSPSFQTRPNDRVEFFYYLSGYNPGQLHVDFIHNDIETGGHRKQWSDLEDHGASLNYGCMKLMPNRTGQLVFTGILGSGAETTIAIKNVSISQGGCEQNVQKNTCTFDNSLLCNYTINCPGLTQYKWKRRKGATPSFGTGPSGDVVKPFNGFYLYAEGSYGSLGDKATISFPVGTTRGSYLHFWYHMYGRGIGSLHLLYQYDQRNQQEWSVSGDQGDKWLYFCRKIVADINAFSLVAQRGSSYLSDIAIDNVQVDNKACIAKSLNCNFDTASICGYNIIGRWSRVNTSTGFKMTAYLSAVEYSLTSPIVLVVDSCVRLHYELLGATCRLNIYENERRIYSLVNNGEKTWMTAQFYVKQSKMYLKMNVYANITCKVSIGEVSLLKENCRALNCPRLMKSCNDNSFCVNKSKVCDSKKDCPDGSDEICSDSLACDFEYSNNCGYFGKNRYYGRVQEFRDNSDYYIAMFGPDTNFTSPLQEVNNSCVQFSYGTKSSGSVEVFVQYYKDWKDVLVWKLSFPKEGTPWSTGQFYVSAGIVRLKFNVKGAYTSQFKLDDVLLLPGACPSFVCKKGFVLCPKNNQCIAETKICNRENDCADKSDESNCPHSIGCDFEQAFLCGYQFDIGWMAMTGREYVTPRLDQSTGTYYGHYMAQRLRNRRLVSPEITLENSTCVRFYYYLREDNSYFRVYDNDVERLRIRSNNLDKWQMAQFQLSSGKHKIAFTQTKSTYRTTLAIDSISTILGPCPQIDCPDKWKRCTSADICIPLFRVCDGENDCPNNEDENNCTTKSRLRLIKGKNVNQGYVEYHRNGTWNKICYLNEFQPSSKANAKVACRELGYSGSTRDTFRTAFATYEISNIKDINCLGNETSLSQCDTKLCQSCYCKHYFSVDCSNNHCWSDQLPCPGPNGKPYTNSSRCIWKYNVCDGEYDCPAGTDEQHCKGCNVGEFRCRDKTCIPQSQRCDGVPDCQDSSDEHECFIQNGTTTMVMQNGTYVALCENNLNDSHLIPNELCKAVGKGHGTILASSKNGQGIEFRAFLNAKNGIIPGYYPVGIVSCKLLNLMCNLKACGTRASWMKLEPSIKYGIFALPGEWPWQVAVFKGIGFICGGTLISETYVLTAAHCVSDASYPFTVMVGSTSKGSGGQRIPVKKIISHSGFDQTRYKNDVALLELSIRTNINNYVQIACLPSKPVTPNTQCFSTGWGTDEHGSYQENLKEAKVRILSQVLCKSYYKYIDKTGLCANHPEPYQPACFGDSGGPLQCLNRYGKWEVVGVTSYGQVRCLGKVDSPEAYADVYEFLDWIMKNAPNLYQ